MGASGGLVRGIIASPCSSPRPLLSHRRPLLLLLPTLPDLQRSLQQWVKNRSLHGHGRPLPRPMLVWLNLERFRLEPR